MSMNKLVTRIYWVNDTDPAINETHLNQMDSELDALDDRVIGLEGACEAQAEEAEAWAVGTRGGDPVDPTDPTYENSAKHWAEQAASSATNAGNSETAAGNSATTASNKATEAGNQATLAAGSATAAASSATDAEAWSKGTRGGVPVGPGDPAYNDSSKYWAGQSAQSQIQANWNESDPTSKAYIQNKPTIPSTASDIGAGTFAGKVRGNSTAMETLGDTQMRNSYIGDTDMTAGTTDLATGEIYFYYT